MRWRAFTLTVAWTNHWATASQTACKNMILSPNTQDECSTYIQYMWRFYRVWRCRVPRHTCMPELLCVHDWTYKQDTPLRRIACTLPLSLPHHIQRSPGGMEGVAMQPACCSNINYIVWPLITCLVPPGCQYWFHIAICDNTFSTGMPTPADVRGKCYLWEM